MAAAKQAGLRLTLAGPIADRRYFQDQVAPELGGPIRYAGHLVGTELAALVGQFPVRALVAEPRSGG
ncbi:hypothetical protein [Streptomyces zaomyceticus]|uniref:hypothetical protein n=1 Tax=Streptomyces zaomyceticus TaxID=68286 RepID=UPI003416EC99